MNPYEELCTKDPRNPAFKGIYGDDDEKPTPRDGCACDNCYYGRDEMALEIIALRTRAAKLEDAVWAWAISSFEEDADQKLLDFIHTACPPGGP
jgi:hypothetical protein